MSKLKPTRDIHLHKPFTNTLLVHSQSKGTLQIPSVQHKMVSSVNVNHNLINSKQCKSRKNLQHKSGVKQPSKNTTSRQKKIPKIINDLESNIQQLKKCYNEKSMKKKTSHDVTNKTIDSKSKKSLLKVQSQTKLGYSEQSSALTHDV